MTVTGRTLGENLADAEVFDEDVIRPLERPFSDKPPIVVLARIARARKRNRQARSARTRPRDASSPARRSFSKTAPMRSRRFSAATCSRGTCSSSAGMGPKGGPGMAGPASRVVFAIDSAGLSDEVAFVSDGQLSGLCLKGIMVAEVSPESAVGGPLALVENGDTISIDVDARVARPRRA